MKTIHINTAKPYDVHIGAGLMDRMGQLLPAKVLKTARAGGKAVLISDEHVAPLYGEKVRGYWNLSDLLCCRRWFLPVKRPRAGSSISVCCLSWWQNV